MLVAYAIAMHVINRPHQVTKISEVTMWFWWRVGVRVKWTL